jgi:uncharacterized protein (DUF2267 family)
MAPTTRRTLAFTAIALAGLCIRDRHVRAVARWARRKARYLEGSLEGLAYRWEGRRPDEEVTDVLLADRVRSMLGPLEKRRDLPHVHVMAEGHTVLLHGEVPGAGDAEAVERAVALMPGVHAVRSFLHVGLLPGDTRPSEGRAEPTPSKAYERLVGAAGAALGDPAAGRYAARAILSVFAGRLPDGARRHLLTHLPDDARALCQARLRQWQPPEQVDTLGDFAIAVAPFGRTTAPDEVTRAIVAVIGELARLVPEETDDVAAVLPDELRAAWRGAVAA